MLLIINDSSDAYYNLAAEEYLIDHFDEDIVMLWRNDNTVVIGKNQNTIEEINKEYMRTTGDEDGMGSGYPSDPKTKDFLKKFKYSEMPEFVRRSWATVQKIKDEESNTSLLDFF